MKLKLILLLSLFYASLSAQSIHQDKLDQYLNHIQSNHLGTGSLSIFKDGREIYKKDFGQADLNIDAKQKPYIYQVGSVTKMVTATLIFKLIEAGKLNLNDKLATFYPQVPQATKISIAHLLSHTSGLGSYVVKDGEVWVTEKVTEGEIMDLILKQATSFEPGEKVSYSNTAYYLLAKILEKKYDLPYHLIAEKEIVKPLGLKHFASVNANPKNVLKSYHFEDGNWKLVKDIDFINVIGVGDISATPQDLNRFNEALFNNKLLTKQSHAAMMPLAGQGWGKGIADWGFEDHPFFGHGGDTLGSHALLIYNPKDRISISYNTNGERIRKEEFTKYILNALYGNPFEYPKNN